LNDELLHVVVISGCVFHKVDSGSHAARIELQFYEVAAGGALR
jgi:hypothetical protein